MSNRLTPFYIAADTENTVPKYGEDITNFTTRVWACGIKPLNAKNVKLFTDLGKMFDTIADITPSGYMPIVYFHNLAWDGKLIFDYLITKRRFKSMPWGDNKVNRFNPWKNHFTTLISEKGQWYSIRLNWYGSIIEIRDSYKILPFKLEKIAHDLKTEHQKLVGEIDYTKDRPVGYILTEEDKRYLENDIHVLEEALLKIAPYGLLDKLTIGSCCMADFKQLLEEDKQDFNALFPLLDNVIEKNIRAAYRGGWCYVNKNYENIKLESVGGYTFDVNSLYPYSMHSKTWDGDRDHIYPIGNPIKRIKSEEDIEKAQNKKQPYFVHISVICKLKQNHLPFIQIKCGYAQKEYLEEAEEPIDLWLAGPDFELLNEQYDIGYLEILDGYIFKGKSGIFDSYINKWFDVKRKATEENNPTLRTIAKLMLNNLYGKFGTSTDASEKIPLYNDKKKQVEYVTIEGEKEGVYIPIAAYITAVAREKTVKAAQANYAGFCYSDTDSIHVIKTIKGKIILKEIRGLIVDAIELGAWDNEARWNKARFVRQKTYAEKINDEWNIKACGAPDSVKLRIMYNVSENETITKDKEDNLIISETGKKPEKRTDDDLLNRFTVGLCERGKMMRKSVSGGVILQETSFRILE